MAYAMTKQGSLDNCITYEFICDTIEDMNSIENGYRTIGTVAIVLSGTSGLEVYIAGSDKQWNSLGAVGANSGSSGSETIVIDGGGFSIHICSSSEIRFGRPNVSAPDEKTIYLIPAEDTSSGNLYDEYIYVNNKWEKFGSGGNIDLSYYVTFQDLYNADYVTHNDLDDAGYVTHNDLYNYVLLDDNGKIPMEKLPLPTITSDDNNKILKVKNEDWSIENEVDISGKIDKEYKINFEPKTWNGLTEIYGSYIWTDGENIYYSQGSNQYILDKSTSTWIIKTWNGLTSFSRQHIWTDGENIYYSENSNQYVLDKSTSTWTTKIWNGLSSFQAQYIWTDGENTYYSYESEQYVLDESTSTWNTKTWNRYTEFIGNFVWTDGENIYYSNGPSQYILDKSTSTWNTKTWNGQTSFSGRSMWTDKENIYNSNGTLHYILDKATSTWNTKTWGGLTTFYSWYIWSDGENIYYSENTKQYILEKGDKILLGNNGTFSPISIKKFTKTLTQELPCLPEAPSTDGTYTLQVTVTDGTPTYSWISAG